MLLQLPSALVDGGFVAGVGIGLGFAATGLGWAFKLVKGSSGAAVASERAFELRVRADADLVELRGVSKQLAATLDISARTLEKLAERQEEQMERVIPAIKLVEQTHERVLAIHRRVVEGVKG